MKSYAKITIDALNTYSKVVQQISDYSSAAMDAMSVFDDLVLAINDEISELDEKIRQLNDANAVIETKIAEYEAKIEETRVFIELKKEDLANIRYEMSVTDEYIGYYDRDGDYHERKNRYYASLERQEAAVERKLSRAYSELEHLEHCLVRCQTVEKELISLLSSIERRISFLNGNKTHVEKNRSEFSSTISSVRNHSLHAISKLSMIGQALDNYAGVRLRVAPAFETAVRNAGSKNLSDVEYMSSKFKNAPSRTDWTGKCYYDDEGKIYKNTEGLIPNSTFRLNNYSFTTDNLGRPVVASGKLRLATEKRARKWDSTLSEMGRGDERPGDNKGHKIGHRFEGPDSIVNAFPQDEVINKGAYRAFEDELASALESGKEVFISITTIYSGNSRRPTGVAISYTIDGERRMRFFDNEHKEDADND